MNSLFSRVIIGGAIIGLASGFASASRVDEEPIQCGTVAFAIAEEANAGATTAASVLLQALGYKTDVRSGDAATAKNAMRSGDVDVVLGPDGAAVREGYFDECKNLAKLLKKMKISPDKTSAIGTSEDEARAWLKSNQSSVDRWLKDVKAWDGKTDGKKAVRKAL